MIVQSHDEVIHLLPALPRAWKDGSVSGLRARGGFEIDIDWENDHVVRAKIKSLNGKPCYIKLNRSFKLTCEANGLIQCTYSNEGIIRFDTVQDGVYILECEPI